jgi:hypothetical protein
MSGAESVGADPNRPVRWWSLAIFVVALLPIYVGIALLVRPVTQLESATALYVAALVSVALATASHDAAFKLLGFRPTRPRFVLVGIAGTLAVGFAAGLLVQEAEWLQQMVEMVREPGQLVATLVTVGGLGPLAEEVVFRGLLFAWLERRWGPRVAVVGSAVAFAAAHMEPTYISFVLPLALFLGWVRWRSNSLWPSLIAHATENCIFVLTARYFDV